MTLELEAWGTESQRLIKTPGNVLENVFGIFMELKSQHHNYMTEAKEPKFKELYPGADVSLHTTML